MGGAGGPRAKGRGRWVLGRVAFPIAAGALSALAIVLVCVLTGISYHMVAYGEPGRFASFAAIGMLTAFLNTLPYVFRSEYGVDRYLGSPPRIGRMLLIWTWHSSHWRWWRS